MKERICEVLRSFELDQHHEKVYDNPNDLVQAGFPAEFLLPLIRSFRSTESYKYFCRGEVVDEMIGIPHSTLIYAIGECLGVPPDTGSQFTGRGFAMRAVINAIHELTNE